MDRRASPALGSGRCRAVRPVVLLRAVHHRGRRRRPPPPRMAAQPAAQDRGRTSRSSDAAFADGRSGPAHRASAGPSRVRSVCARDHPVCAGGPVPDTCRGVGPGPGGAGQRHPAIVADRSAHGRGRLRCRGRRLPDDLRRHGDRAGRPRLRTRPVGPPAAPALVGRPPRARPATPLPLFARIRRGRSAGGPFAGSTGAPRCAHALRPATLRGAARDISEPVRTGDSDLGAEPAGAGDRRGQGVVQRQRVAGARPRVDRRLARRRDGRPTPAQVRRGLEWEIAQIAEGPEPPRIMLVVAPWPAEELARRWQGFVAKAGEWPLFAPLVQSPPPTGTQVLTWTVESGWRCYGARRRWDWSYAAAILAAVDAAAPASDRQRAAQQDPQPTRTEASEASVTTMGKAAEG